MSEQDLDLQEILGVVWDNANAMGLDGWIGPGRGAGEVDDEAVRGRERDLLKAEAAILAAGYRKPRTITTLNELNALPNEVVVLDADNVACQQDFGGVWTSGGELLMPELIPLPAVVLWEPNE